MPFASKTMRLSFVACNRTYRINRTCATHYPADWGRPKEKRSPPTDWQCYSKKLRIDQAGGGWGCGQAVFAVGAPCVDPVLEGAEARFGGGSVAARRIEGAKCKVGLDDLAGFGKARCDANRLIVAIFVPGDQHRTAEIGGLGYCAGESGGYRVGFLGGGGCAFHRHH